MITDQQSVTDRKKKENSYFILIGNRLFKCRKRSRIIFFTQKDPTFLFNKSVLMRVFYVNILFYLLNTSLINSFLWIDTASGEVIKMRCWNAFLWILQRQHS